MTSPWRAPGDGATGAAAPPAPGNSTPDAGAERRPDGRRRPHAPLPGPDLPFAETLGPLVSLAENGHAGAHCRLAVEASRCAAVAFRRADFERWVQERGLALSLTDGEAGRREFAATLARESALREQQLAAEEAHCQGTTGSRVDPLHHWREAALAGHPAALRAYASGRAFRADRVLDQLDALARYRAEAAGLAERGARSGDLVMVLALGSALSPIPPAHRSLLAQAVRPDGAKALALMIRGRDALEGDDRLEASTLHRDLQFRIEELERHLSEPDRVRAREIARDFDAGWRPVDTRTLPGRFAAQGAVAPADARECG